MSAIVLDVETASLYGDVIELAWMPALAVSGLTSYRFEPSHEMDPGAAAVHGINPASLKGCQLSHCAAGMVPQDAEFWIGHNVVYDWKRLGCPAGVKLVCTYRLSEMVWPGLRSYKLDALYLDLFGINDKTLALVAGSHCAVNDVTKCNEVLRKIIHDTGVKDVSQLPRMSHPSRWSEEVV